MPAVITADPLSAQFLLPDGTSWTADLSGLSNPRLAADLALGLPLLTHPHGGIGTSKTAEFYAGGLRRMVEELTDAGFTGGAAQLTRPVMVRYWLAATPRRNQITRRLLEGFDAATGLLAEPIREHLRGRPLKPKTPSKPHVPYTEAEWATLIDRCEQITGEAFAAQQAMLARAEASGDPRQVGLSEDSLAWLMSRRGPLSAPELAELAGMRQALIHDAGQVRVATALFPTTGVALAYLLLLGAYTGIVPDGLADLGLADVAWAGETTVLLDYIKGRTGRESLNLPQRGVRILQRWLKHSALLRSFVPAQLQPVLWIKVSPVLGRSSGTVGGHLASALRIQSPLLPRWVRDNNVTVDGRPIALHRARIRTTYQNLLARRGWTGRTTIDPNHSGAVEGDHYLSVATPAQRDAVETVIEQGQADLLRKARPVIVLGDADAARTAEAFPALVADHGLDVGAVAELLAGERDVFLAACANQLASPYGQAGKPCPARPWVCLLCPLAVFLPRHIPNLLRLKEFFAGQFRQHPTTVFMAVFGPYAQRLDTDILPCFDEQAITAAANALAGDPAGFLPLRPEELA